MVTCIFVYDNCTDNSPRLLREYQDTRTNVIVRRIENPSTLRTVRIAKARNTCLEEVYKLPNVQYHMMIDSDDVVCGNWNIDLLRSYVDGSGDDDWDCMSFDKDFYYDIWALLFDDFKHHCWGFSSEPQSARVVEAMREEIKQRLNDADNDSIEVMSAFNGFAIYKTQRFRGFKYDGTGSSFMTLFSDDERAHLEAMLLSKHRIRSECVLTDESCEHLYYHVKAFKSGRKIKVSKSRVAVETRDFYNNTVEPQDRTRRRFCDS